MNTIAHERGNEREFKIFDIVTCRPSFVLLVSISMDYYLTIEIPISVKSLLSNPLIPNDLKVMYKV